LLVAAAAPASSELTSSKVAPRVRNIAGDGHVHAIVGREIGARQLRQHFLDRTGEDRLQYVTTPAVVVLTVEPGQEAPSPGIEPETRSATIDVKAVLSGAR
jgi:hypothetical protein